MSLTDRIDDVGNTLVANATTLIDHTGEPAFVALTAAAVGCIAWCLWKFGNPHRGQDPRPAGAHTGTALVDLGGGPLVRLPAARPGAGTTLMLSATAAQQTNVGPDGESAYDTVGPQAIRTAVDQFYALVAFDPDLSPYFATVDRERLHRHQALFIGQLWGGPVHFDPDVLITAHQQLHITAAAYWRTVGILMTVLTGLEVPDWICQFTLSALYDIRGKVINEQPDRPDDGT